MPKIPKKKSLPLWLYILSRCEIVDGCFMWQGGMIPNGYGMIRGQMVHRVIYKVFKGAIPDGLVVDHICNNRLCVNPAHLEVVTHSVNILRGHGQSARNARKTHCKRGHPLTGTNLYAWAQTRRCKICCAIRDKAYHERKANAQNPY